MLYLVPDPMLAIREAHRVLVRNGKFAALVNHLDTTPFLMSLVADAGHSASGSRVHSDNLPGMVTEVFGHAHVTRHDNALLFDNPQPVIDYAMSCLTQPVPPAVAQTIKQRAHAWFASHPGEALRDPKGYVIVTATR